MFAKVMNPISEDDDDVGSTVDTGVGTELRIGEGL